MNRKKFNNERNMTDLKKPGGHYLQNIVVICTIINISKNKKKTQNRKIKH